MRLDAAASSCLRPTLAGPARPATWLGVTPAALYLRTGTQGVVALLAHDAVRLPCALVLPTTSSELPLICVADGSRDAVLGDGQLAWTGPAGPVVVRSVREWSPARVRTTPPGFCPAQELRGCGSGAPLAARDSQPRCWLAAGVLAAARGALPDPATLGIDGTLLADLIARPAAAVAGLLGRGPGLTPAGDDVLAGFLLGARAVGLDVPRVRAAVATLAPARTTALSAVLLWHAARGECIPEFAAFLDDASAPALDGLLRVGHTSGAALATGLATAALAALTAEAGEAA